MSQNQHPPIVLAMKKNSERKKGRLNSIGDDRKYNLLIHGCTILTLMKRKEKRLDWNYKRIVSTLLNQS